MAVTFPDWWTEDDRGKLVKIEDVGIALFTEAANNAVLGGVHLRYWLDTDQQTQQVLFGDAEAYLRVVRLGGEVDFENNKDIHRVQFAAAHEDRDVAWDILAFVQRVLYAYERTSYVTMPSGAKVALEFMGETLGPLLDPQQIRDARLVPVTFQLGTPWPKGIHDKVRRELGL